MPNYCDYEMKIKGRPEDVDAFVTIIKANYDEVPKHFRRVFYADVYDEREENGMKSVCVGGYCAWSVYSCMCDGVCSCNRNTKTGENEPDGTTLEEQSKLLNLDIEVYSSEPGMGFQEHYIYEKGNEIINECIDYSELYFNDEDDFEANKIDYGLEDFTYDDVDEDGYIKIGGFEDWNFKI